MMARGNEGWDFIKEGAIYQYKEDGMVCMVRVLEDFSDEACYRFRIKVLASNRPVVGEEFLITYTKSQTGYYSGMSQFYETPEYIPLPLGTPWPYFDEEEFKMMELETE